VIDLSLLIPVSGGLGLFLLGMIIMTDGLRGLAGEAIRYALFRFTRNPFSGVLTGASSTALLQSSSATTVAAVGFVAAGLMTFSEAIGIILGANVGTTVTGWLVTLLGFKFKLGTYVLPIIFIGAIIKLFARGKFASLGLALAGFGLIFTGISLLQEGMAGLQSVISLDALAGDTVTGRISLVLLGIVFTIITQSSSAGVATALTALFTGLINFEQAAALVIGMDVGTTVTAAMATLGASTGARRTGYSHVIFNLFVGLMAFFLITPYQQLWDALSPGLLQANAEIALVAFHTSFNVLGVVIILPFTRNYARFIERIVPGHESSLIQKLDKSLLDEPGLAIKTVQQVIHEEFLILLNHIRWLVTGGQQGGFAHLSQLQNELDETQLYIDHIHVLDKNAIHRQHLLEMIHALDHLQRMHERCDEDESRVVTARETAELVDECNRLNDTIETSLHAIHTNDWYEAVRCSAEQRLHIYEQDAPHRERIMQAIANFQLDVPQGTRQLEATRWLRRVSHHIARISAHLANVSNENQKS